MESSTFFNDYNDLLLLFYKICSPICFVLHGLAVYLIIFKSNLETKTYRWHLLHYQIWAFAIDIFLNILYQPVHFYPLVLITGHGFLITNLGISTFTCNCIEGNLLCGLSASIIQLFLYRHQRIVGSNFTKRQFCFCILLPFFIVSVSTNIFRMFSRVDSSQWREMLEKWDPRAVELLKIPNVYYMPFSESLLLLTFTRFFFIVFTGLIISGLVCRIFYVLRKQSEHLSLQTRQMQRKFLISLIWQVTVPLVFLIIPLIFERLRVFDGRLGLQILNNIARMMVSSYGILATLCLIYFNEPYREFLLGMLKRKRNHASVISEQKMEF